MAELGNLEGLFQPKEFYDSVNTQTYPISWDVLTYDKQFYHLVLSPLF